MSSFYDSFDLSNSAGSADGKNDELSAALTAIRAMDFKEGDEPADYSGAGAKPTSDSAQAKDSSEDRQMTQRAQDKDYDSGAKTEKFKSNSTSTLYVRSTLQVPDVDRILLSMSMLLEHLMDKNVYEFDIFTRHSLPGKKDISMETIFKFMKNAFKIAQWSPECNVIAMVLISRLTASTEATFNINNWDKVILCALLLAQKLWDDIPLSNVDFPTLWSQAFPDTTTDQIDLKEVNRMEQLFLELLHYDVNVTRGTYTQFYFELRALSSENADNSNLAIPQLTTGRAEALETRSATFAGQLMTFKEKRSAVNLSSKSANFSASREKKGTPLILS